MWAAFVDSAKLSGRIEGDACAIAMLVHAADALMLDHEFFRDVIQQRRKLDEQVATFAAGGAKREIVGRNGHRCHLDHAQQWLGGDHSFLSR